MAAIGPNSDIDLGLSYRRKMTDAVEKIGKERAERLAGTFEGLFSAALAVPSANRVCSIYPQAV